ncbi:MAG TPA: glycoside hydrolase family 3 protein [Rhodothermales bacterium]|nr:glycoside hydrolase family 3 protein [Rhodothermales bacterium]
MESLPLRDKAAGLVVARLGSNMPPGITVEEDAARVEALLQRCPLGGLVVFNGNVTESPGILAHLQRVSKYPLLVGSDIERGFGQQFRGGTVFPHAMAFSALGADAERLLEDSARVTAREALACGVHIAFAPVADVNRNLANPIISTRAFGTEPRETAGLVRAYVRGCRDEGLLTAAKHFPGHGNTSEDSHDTVPVVRSPRRELDELDLVPFKAAIGEDVPLVMTAHVSYPALDPTGLPATLSQPILHDLLRDKLHFQGAVITDSMLMGAVRGKDVNPGEQAAALLNAGVDIILDPPEPELIVDGIVEAVQKGRLTEARLDEALGRITALKKRLTDRFGGDFFVNPSRYVPGMEVGSAEHRCLAEDVARRAVTIQSAAPGLLPLDPVQVSESGLLAVLIRPWRSRLDPPEAPLGEGVRMAFPGAHYVEIGPEAGDAEFTGLARHAGEVGHVLLALVVKPAAWQNYGLLPPQQQFVHELVARRPVMLASLGSPYALRDFPNAAARLCTYSDVPVSQRALVSALVGKPPHSLG